MSRREAKRLTDIVIEEMAATLASGESLKLHDFGSFVVRTKHERSGRNPRTGAPVPIQARRVVVFKASPNMKASINGEAPAARRKRGASRKLARQPADAVARKRYAAASDFPLVRAPSKSGLGPDRVVRPDARRASILWQQRRD